MTERERLPNRRGSESFRFECNGVPYGCTYSRFADGRLAEVFVESNKNGSAADIVSRDAAIACSFALQHGADADLIRRSLCRDIHGKAQGPLAIALDKIVGLAVVK
jgi:hypothetical protein